MPFFVCAGIGLQGDKKIAQTTIHIVVCAKQS